MRHKFILIAIIFLFLFGCTEMTQSEKNLCYSLSSRSYDYVPSCSTEESCYEKVESSFQTNLLYTQETKLYELKNHIARSWFYYNQAVKEIKKISTLCKSGNALSLSSSLNQMNFYLDNAFLELDQGMKQSFEIINFQEQFLLSEKIDLLKEENLYNSLIELKQIISELENGQTNSDSYVSYYLEQVDNFNKNSSTTYRPIIEKQPFWLSAYSKVDKYLIGNTNLGKIAYFPVISDYFKKAISYLEFSFYKDESLKTLESFPVAQFMQLYSKLGGEKNSAFARFVDLVNKTSANYSLLTKKHESLIKEVVLLERDADEKYYQISQNPTNTFIKSKLLASKIIPKESYQEQIINLKNKFIQLGEHRSGGNLSLGEDIQQLKLLKNDYLILTKSIEENVSSETENLNSACESFAQKVIKDIKTSQELENYVLELTYLANKVISTKESKLPYCENLILLDEDYQLGLADYEELKSKKIDSTKICFDYLEKIFIYKSFFEIQNLFNELKNTQVTQSNILFFNEACNTLKNQVDNELSSDFEIKKIIEQINDLEKIFDEITLNLVYFQDPLFEKEFAKNQKTFNSLKNSVYTNNFLDYSKLLPITIDFQIKISQLNTDTTLLYENKIIEFIKKNINITVIDSFVQTANQNQQIQKRIIVDNPFREINKKITIPLEFGGEIISKDPQVEQIFENNLILTSIPKGKTKVDIIVTENILQIEKIEHILVTNTNSIFQKSIELSSKSSFPKIIIQTEKPIGTYKTILFKNGIEQNFIENDLNIIYSGELLSGEKIIIYFYITGLISTNFEMTQNYKTNRNTIQTFKIIMKNMTDQELNATLTLPIKSNKTVEIVTITNELKEKLKFTTVNDELIVKNELFLPKQTKLYYLTLEINDIFEYYQDELKSVYDQLIYYGETNITSEINKFLMAIPGENYSEDAQKLLKKATSALDLIKKEKLSEAELLATKERLKDKIDELEKILKKANELKLNDLNSLEKLLDASILALESNNETQIFTALSNIEKYSFSINGKLKENAEKMWSELTKNTTNSVLLSKLKDDFFNEKQIFDETINFDPERGNLAYIALEKIYQDFVKNKNEILANQKENELDLITKIDILKNEINGLLIFLESELSVDEKDLIKSKFIPPITQTRLKKIALELASIESLEANAQYLQLENIKRELNTAADYLKSKTIKAYNLAIDNQFSIDQLKKAKTLIDNNKYLSAYFLLQENTISSGQNYYYYFIPIILIVIIGLFLRYKIKKEKNDSKKSQTNIEKEWN